MIRREDFGVPFAIHASREIDGDVLHGRLREIAPDLFAVDHLTDEELVDYYPEWARLSRITSAVIAVATIDKVFDGWDEDTILEHADALSFSNGEKLGPGQVRWFFGPVGYVLRDVHALREPVPCRGWQGFWTLSLEVEARVEEQLR